jgi:transcriptional regulator with XRE-family HTH domain
MKKTSSKSNDGIAILHQQFYEGKPDRLAGLEEARANAEIARKIVQLRNDAGLSQRELAKFVGTTASVICRLEDADYEGHSLSMLRRIAMALNRRVEIRFVPLEKKMKTFESLSRRYSSALKELAK